MVFWKPSEARQSSKRLCSLVLAEQEAGSLRSEECADAPDEGGNKLKCGRELPLEVCSGVVLSDTVVEEEAEDDAELLTAGVLEG